MKNNIRKIREELEITQEGLANTIGITRPYLSAIENDRKNPSCTIADKIAKALDRPFGEIFYTE